MSRVPRRYSKILPFLAALLSMPGRLLLAADASPAPILQWFDSSYVTQEKRVADFFMAGYGSTWIPPVGRADSGNQSVGYDVFDRFDLGQAGNSTLYGTEQGLRNFASTMHRAGGDVIVDLVWNHNGFSDMQRSGFLEQGGYPGFLLTHPDAIDGDFHSIFQGGDLNGRLAGLIDFRHEMNLQYIRSPVDPADPRNIPAGTIWNRPDPNNARFYADRDQPGSTVFNPLTGQTVTLYEFNQDNPLAGDAVPENALGALMRNARWLINDVGVDGYRIDAARHFEPWVFGYFDEAVYRANRRNLLDGSPREVFSFSESASTDRSNLLSQFVRKDAGRLPAGQITGNRDALDFAQFWPIKENLSSNGTANDFRNMVNAGLDVFDDGLVNGSAGVVFVQSHDDFGPDLMNVAYAFSLMRPGNAIVYHNANEHYDEFRNFPKPGRGDALGNFGDTITTLVDLRNRYGRGDYRERWLEKETYAFERSGSALVMLSNRNDGGFDTRTMDVDFALGSRLVELTGNAARANAEAGSTTIPEVLTVTGTGSNRQVTARFLRNDGRDQGYLVYGLPTPVSAAGLELAGAAIGPVIAGDDPPEFQGGETAAQTGAILIANAQARLADMQVITDGSFTVRLATQAVTLPGGYRDRSADGDQAMLRINEGLDLNGNGRVDVVAPGDVSYGFEEFVTTRQPGFQQASGNGLFEQTVDASLMPEGMNFLTVRAYRHRDPGTGGDNGPPVYSEFKQVLYVDRLPPEATIEGLEPFGTITGSNDVKVRSVDGTAESVHIFPNVAATVSEATLLGWANAGLNRADQLDGDLFKRGFFSTPNGNNTYTVVTREITGTTNVQRFTGIRPDSARGAGFGDLNFDGNLSAADMTGTNYAFEKVLSSKNTEFNAAADVTGDGLVDTRDLAALEPLLAGSGAALTAFEGVKGRRLDFSGDGLANETDLALLRVRVGQPASGDTLWASDIDVDGVIGQGDVTMLQQQFGVAPAAGVPATLGWTGGDDLAGGDGTWSAESLGWRGAVTDATLPMPLVPGSKAVFGGSGGTVTVSGIVRAVAGIDVTSTGTTEFAGGTIEISGDSAGGRISVAGGGAAVVGSAVNAAGLVKAGGGRLTLAAANGITGNVLVEAGELAVTSTAALGGQGVDLTGGRLILETGSRDSLDLPSLAIDLAADAGVGIGVGRLAIAAGGMSEADLRAALVAGRNGGSWDGLVGISSADAGSGRAVGYVVNGDGSTTVAYAAPGDTDLNGQVDVFDLVAMTTGGSYGSGAAAVWATGDFNYDGLSNVFDLVDVETGGAFNQGDYLPVTATVATVPEPSLLLLSAAVAIGYVVRRRRA